VEFIPKALVVGVFAAVPGAADIDKINRIWMQLSRRMGYRQLVHTGEGGAQFVGASGDDAFLIQPPLLQFRSPATLGFANAADDARACLKTAAEQLGATQFANLGIKHVLHATAADNDARAYIQRQLLATPSEILETLARGGTTWVGVKYGAEDADGTSAYTLVVEPLISDPAFVFIDLDAQYAGPADLDRITDRVEDAGRYLTEIVRPYLEGPPTTA
jgi:hypothetical protein